MEISRMTLKDHQRTVVTPLTSKCRFKEKVSVTNENKTSQICVFCFKKLTHPKRKEIKKPKDNTQEHKRGHSCVQIPRVSQ